MTDDALIYKDNPFVGVDSYHTDPARRAGLLAKVAPSLVFYYDICKIVYKSARMAKAGVYGSGEWVMSSLWVIEALERIGAKISVEGLGGVNSLDTPVVYAANHMSTLETFVLPSILRPCGPVTFVVKQSLLDYPFFGQVLRVRHPIAVGRSNPREDLMTVMNEGKRLISEGFSVIIFPQTTRTDTFSPSKFNTIAAKLAARAGVPLVPLALTTNCWGSGKLVKDFGKVDASKPVRFSFGEPLMPEGKGNEAHEAAVRFISSTFAKWGLEIDE